MRKINGGQDMLTSSSNICVKKTNDKCKPYQTHQIEPPRTSKYRILNLISRNTANENSIRKHKFWTRSVQTAKKLFQTLFPKRTSPTTVKAEKGNVQMAFYSFSIPTFYGCARGNDIPLLFRRNGLLCLP